MEEEEAERARQLAAERFQKELELAQLEKEKEVSVVVNVVVLCVSVFRILLRAHYLLVPNRNNAVAKRVRKRWSGK